MTEPQGDANYRTEVNEADVEQLGAQNPNVAGNRDSDQAVDHEANMGDEVNDDNAALDAERAAAEGAAETEKDAGQ